MLNLFYSNIKISNNNKYALIIQNKMKNLNEENLLTL